MDWKALFLSAEGRINRQTFWVGIAATFVASMVAGALPLIGGLVKLALLWPQVCLNAKRLHDMGRTGWLMLVPVAVAVAAMSLAMAFGGAAFLGAGLLHHMGANLAGHGAFAAGLGAAGGFMAVAMLVGLAFLLWIGLTPGEAGDNRFGPPPPPGLPTVPPPASPPQEPPAPPPQPPIVE